jgi:hypothetical protein
MKYVFVFFCLFATLAANANFSQCQSCISNCNKMPNDQLAEKCLENCLAQNFCRNIPSNTNTQLFEVGFDDGSDVGFPQVQYLSWCEKNKWMEYNSKGAVVLKHDCSIEQKTCKQQERRLGGSLFVFATCQ